MNQRTNDHSSIPLSSNDYFEMNIWWFEGDYWIIFFRRKYYSTQGIREFKIWKNVCNESYFFIDWFKDIGLLLHNLFHLKVFFVSRRKLKPKKLKFLIQQNRILCKYTFAFIILIGYWNEAFPSKNEINQMKHYSNRNQ